MIEKILREATKNLFTQKWYKETAKAISGIKSPEEDPETVNVFNNIKKANNQYDGEWLTIFEILERTNLEIGNQKLGTVLSKKGFSHKISRKNGGTPKKRYYVRLL